ncbi:MAG: alpha/beta hydrolase [Puniceicoccales bacterium]|jgi:pimeloyl-[acyl-carrier protein] methyl ester esterase|nr:alpha/beta hydrolase [Puniceicoccales bacterium]
MNSYTFILAHGFGFDHSYWGNFINRLNGQKWMFFKDNLVLDPREKYIGLGHSLGFAKLSNSTLNFDILVGLQCFCNFLGNGEKLRRLRKPHLDRMVSSVHDNPTAHLEQFYNSCGQGIIPKSKPDTDRLAMDLQMLYNSFLPRQLPTLIIGGTKDEIVPKSLIEDNFRSHSQVTIKYLDLAGHTLGYDLASEVIKTLIEFIRDHESPNRQ